MIQIRILYLGLTIYYQDRKAVDGKTEGRRVRCRIDGEMREAATGPGSRRRDASQTCNIEDFSSRLAL